MIQIDMEMPKCCRECFVGFCKQIKCEKHIGFENYKTERHPNCPLKEVPSGKKQAILDELAKESDMLISTAYLYAKAFVSYGVDVTQVWTTAVQQTANLEQAHKRGYYEALKMVEEQTGENT